MKITKTRIIALLIALLLLSISACSDNNNSNAGDTGTTHPVDAGDTGFSQRPFNDLRTEDISSISVFAIPPNETVVIDDMEQIEIIVEILRTVVIYQSSDEWKDSAGQMVTFTLNKATDEVVEVSAYNPHLIIDGQGYRTEYQPCENLNRIANTLLDTQFGGRPIE